MALQIRRGTDAERQLVIPLQGELIFTTDTKRLYVGDGTTQGGIAVDTVGTGGGASAISELTDVLINAPTTGQVLKWDGTNWVNSADNEGTTVGSIGDISDVSITTPTAGQVLKFNGTNWVNDTDLNDGTGTVAIEDITNVFISTPTAGQVLKFDGSLWVNGPDDAGSTISSIADISDVAILTPAAGQSLIFNGSFWVNDTTSLEDASDVVLTNPIANDVLYFNGVSWANGPAPIGSLLSTYQGLLSGELINLYEYTDNARINLFKANGDSPSTPTTVVLNDTLGTVASFGYNGTEFVLGSQINTRVESSTLGTGLPTRIEFVVNNSSNQPKSLLDISGETNRVISTAPLYLFSENPNGASSQVAIFQSHETADANNFSFFRSRGTNAAPTTIQDGDDVIDFSFLAHDGTSYALAGSISFLVDGAPSTGVVPGKLVFRTRNATGTAERLVINGQGNVVVRSALQVDNDGGFGYTVGAGGAETQLTDKTTSVTLNKVTGEITLASDSLAANTSVSFTLTNSSITPTDHIIVTHVSGGSLGAYGLTASAGTGSALITLRNLTSSPLSESLVIKYTVIRSSIT